MILFSIFLIQIINVITHMHQPNYHTTKECQITRRVVNKIGNGIILSTY